MKNMLWIMGLIVVTALAGCAQVPERGSARAGYGDGPGYWVDRAGPAIDLGDLEAIKTALYAQYDEWKGTPYQLGGMSRDSVDCSAFIHITFKSKLGVILPRSTVSQVELGRSVAKDKLRAGDLLFFKTGKSLRHVGVYVEDGRFMHASTSQGVVISNLHSNYWRSAYWKAKRLEM